MKLRHKLSLAGALCALLLPVTTAQADAVSPKTYNVWQWNVAGDSIHDGRTDTGMVDAAVGSIVYRGADFAALNELCENQYDALVAKLRIENWPQNADNFARFEPSRQGGNKAICKNGAYGNAIFSKRPLGPADRIALPDDGTAEKRNMLCAGLLDGSGTRFCTTHITKELAFSTAQLDAVHTQLEAHSGESVLIAGDFNAQPDYGRLNTFYTASANTPNNPNNAGEYRELDDNDEGQCLGYGEWTVEGSGSNTPPCGPNAKIDLIFVRESALAGPYSADSLGISAGCTYVPGGLCSDHRILTGTVTVK
ncbi:endonuclease/exonuclease/phosphatase family protein [Streptomyces sp. NPDC051183]|uniref:endonuclease/exonuclease/phosphatase family protein n=1 Tax=Streptomyces sp. NPDC051183 TaxID=3155165 RepID=UPI003424273E